MILRLLVMSLLLLALTATVNAAEPVRDLGQLAVAPDTLLFVRTTTNAEIRGRFLRATSNALTLNTLDGRELTLMAAEIGMVWRRGDRLRNGAIIGALFGVAAAIGGQSRCSDCSGDVAVAMLVGVPIWSGVGALIDRQHVGRTLIYRAP